MTEHPTHLLPAFALECLDRVEQEEIQLHIEQCPPCRADLYRFQQTVAELAHAVPQVEPPATLKPRLLASIHSNRAPSWFEKLLMRWPRMVPSLSLVALLLLIVLGIGNVMLIMKVQHSTQTDLVSVQLAQLRGTDAMPQAHGVLLIGEQDKQGVLVVTALQPLDASSQYQLWLIKDGQRSSGGVFSVGSAGEARLTIMAHAPISSYDAFGVTIEPYGGSPGPTGQKVLGGHAIL